MTKPTVFISYSHKDEEWKERLYPHLGMLEDIAIWDDRKIDPDGRWFNEIKPIIDRAAAAVCLISADYLATRFCKEQEIPYLLERREKEGMIIIPVLIRPCQWWIFPWLKKVQVLPRDGDHEKKKYKYVATDFEKKYDEVFLEVGESIYNIISDPKYRAPEPVLRWQPPEKIDTHRLPMTGEELFGRQRELEILDKAWESDQTRIISLVAWGGVGKSTLVNKWLEHMASDNYRGARRVYAWSFHSQGTGEKVTFADLFFAEALAWFGDPDPTKGSPWDKGERLAELIRKEKTLLVLDGLEPLQSPYEYERGKLKDPGMATLLSELARKNSGMCIITTREAVSDLSLFNTACKIDLEQFSDEAGRALLRISGVQGSDAELEAATRGFGNHALAVILLGTYLKKIPGHHVSQVSTIPELDIPESEGRHPRRMMEAFEKYFGKGPEMELLKMLGLFNRPADGGAIRALKAAPSVKDLTEHLQKLSEAEWLRLLLKLREFRLIAPESRHDAEVLDAHPLIREHFGQKLRNKFPEAWVEGNNRLYEHYKSIAKEYPDTIEEMIPLYHAVVHGCQAGRHQEAIEEVYSKRIQRGEEYFNMKKLGAFGADLAVLSGFFDVLWSQPVVGLEELSKSYVLNEVGFDLWALGRLAEAAQSFNVSMNACILQKDWKRGAIRSINLSGLYLTMGNIPQALNYAKQSVEMADKGGDAFRRMESRTVEADALHQMGSISEAESIFLEAEEIQKKEFPKNKLEEIFKYHLMSYRYCNLLLTQRKYRDVVSFADQTLKWAIEGNWLLDISLANLCLGRAYLLQALMEKKDDFTKAAEHLNQAVDGLRRAGTQDELPRGLLARAELYRVRRELDKAQRDLDEAATIAERGEMGLHKADCHLGYARLYLAKGDKEKARENLAKAKEMIQKMGYHRRDREVEELEKNQ